MQLRQQPQGSYSLREYFARTALPFLIPALLYVVSAVLGLVLTWTERWEDKSLKSLDQAKKKLIKELKVRGGPGQQAGKEVAHACQEGSREPRRLQQRRRNSVVTCAGHYQI